MSTKIRPEVSKKNEFYINKHRQYELKHFCMQYPMWKKICSMSLGIPAKNYISFSDTDKQYWESKTEKIAMLIIKYGDRINLVEKVARETDPVLGIYILIGITEGVSYDAIKAKYNIPCCKDMYYRLYRKFFWILDKERD